MPELPEVESIRRSLEEVLIGKVFEKPQIYYEKMVKTSLSEFCEKLQGQRIVSLKRKGKVMIFVLTDYKLLFHLRMEGKLYVVNKRRHDENHLSMLLPFEDDDALAFYDVRKFGVCHLLEKEEEGPLASLGKEPFEMNPEELYQKIHAIREPIKSTLMNQNVISGIGNIYADEILFASMISPFRSSSTISLEDCETILKNAVRILNQAISDNGSTVRTYHITKETKGSFQDKLHIYGKKGDRCDRCGTKIEKRFLKGRGTSFCPRCQNVGISIAVTGKIASGKSLVCSYFDKLGYARFSADDEVHKLYKDPVFLSELKKAFPMVFRKNLLKNKVSKLLKTKPDFRRKYQNFIFKEIRARIDAFYVNSDGRDKVLEIPLLFEARLEKDFTYTIGVETTKQEEHLRERGENPSRKSFNHINAYDLHRDEFDFILKTDSTKEALFEEVKILDQKIKEK